MTKKERQYLIAFIQANDSTYDYNAVNFKYYSDMDLLVLKAKLELKMSRSKPAVNEDFVNPDQIRKLSGRNYAIDPPVPKPCPPTDRVSFEPKQAGPPSRGYGRAGIRSGFNPNQHKTN